MPLTKTITLLLQFVNLPQCAAMFKLKYKSLLSVECMNLSSEVENKQTATFCKVAFLQ